MYNSIEYYTTMAKKKYESFKLMYILFINCSSVVEFLKAN